MPARRSATKRKQPTGSNLARRTLPRYEADNGPLTQKQMDELRRLQPAGRMKVNDSLF